jgi:O-antigen/teichoic acid export membrane protein
MAMLKSKKQIMQMTPTPQKQGGRRLSALSGWRPGALARASFELTGWLLLRAAIQVITIFGLAKFLGPRDYGAFITLLAISGIAASIAGLGLPSVVLRDGSRQPSKLPFLLRQTLSAWWPSVFIFAIGTSAIAYTLPPIEASWLPIHFMILMEVASISMAELLARTFQAQQNTRAYGAMHIGLPLARLAALTIAWLIGVNDFTSWLYLYTVANISYMGIASWWTRSKIGWKSGSDGLPWTMIREGIPFTTAGISVRLQTEYNKPLLAQAAFAHAGNFNIAQRAVDLISLPVLAVQEALWPRLYADADHRRRLLIAGLALMLMSLTGAFVLIVGAQLVPLVLGDDFRIAADLMAWLAFLPILTVVRNIGTFHLVATGRTRLLTWVYVIGGISGVTLSTLLISRHGLLGSVWANYATEAISIITVSFFVRSGKKSEKNIKEVK